MLGNVDQSRSVSTAEALNTRFRVTRSLYVLPVKDKDKVRDNDKDSEPSNHTRIEVGRWLIPLGRTGHLSKFRPPTSLPTTSELWG